MSTAPRSRGSPRRPTGPVRTATPAPEGFRYQPDLISPAEEAELVGALASFDFEPFDFHGHLAHRHVVGFGFRYDYASRSVRAAPPIPTFLEPLRQKVGAFAGLEPEAFQQVLINQYRPGAGIGWHRDKPQYDEVVGVSLLAPCVLRFPKKAAERWERISVPVAALGRPADRPLAAELGTQHRVARAASLFNHAAHPGRDR